MISDKPISTSDDRHKNFTKVIESGITPDQSLCFQSKLTIQTVNGLPIINASSTQINSRQLEAFSNTDNEVSTPLNNHCYHNRQWTLVTQIQRNLKRFYQIIDITKQIQVTLGQQLSLNINGSMAKSNSDYGTMAEQFTFTKDNSFVRQKRESCPLSKTIVSLYAFLGDSSVYTLSLRL